MGIKPADGMTREQPFISGTGESRCFRIPSLVTLSDGSLLAAVDARWNHTGDGYGLDTIVSRSRDRGVTWEYTFANYLGDNGNCYHPDSTAFIDPAMTVKGDTVYLLTDLYPGGIDIVSAKPGSGFDEYGYLMLKGAEESSYEYRLKPLEKGRAGIFSLDGRQVEGVHVDDHFNCVYYDAEGAERTSNLFFSDCPWKVFPTCYLYLVRSDDGGRTWKAPSILNPQVKKETEGFYGVGPGRGLILQSGRILFPCYVYNGVEKQRASFIYSDDDGMSWKRSPDATRNLYSGESQLIEMRDGTIRCFFRNNQKQICYVDAVEAEDGYCWKDENRTGIPCCPDCQNSVLAYSKDCDSRQVILVSCPKDTAGRRHGVIYRALADEDGKMVWDVLEEITGDGEPFSYSCLTELSDGTLAVLYEGGAYPVTFQLVEKR